MDRQDDINRAFSDFESALERVKKSIEAIDEWLEMNGHSVTKEIQDNPPRESE